jgi:hypothetical protein
MAARGIPRYGIGVTAVRRLWVERSPSDRGVRLHLQGDCPVLVAGVTPPPLEGVRSSTRRLTTRRSTGRLMGVCVCLVRVLRSGRALESVPPHKEEGLRPPTGAAVTLAVGLHTDSPTRVTCVYQARMGFAGLLGGCFT